MVGTKRACIVLQKKKVGRSLPSTPKFRDFPSPNNLSMNDGVMTLNNEAIASPPSARHSVSLSWKSCSSIEMKNPVKQTMVVRSRLIMLAPKIDWTSGHHSPAVVLRSSELFLGRTKVAVGRQAIGEVVGIMFFVESSAGILEKF